MLHASYRAGAGEKGYRTILLAERKKTNYSGIAILGIDGDRVLLECYSVHSASNSRIIIIIISIIIPARERC